MTSLTVTSSKSASRSSIQPGAVFVLGAIFIFGALAAQRVSPTIWVTTAIVFIVVARGARTEAPTTTQRLPDDDLSAFPPATRRLILGTRQRLTSPDAQHLLKVVIEGAGPLLAAMTDEERNRSSRRDVVALVEGSCDLSEELNRVDAFLAQPHAAADAPGRELLDRSNATRTKLADRLTEACTAIETLHAQLLEERTDAADRVAELAQELTEEARVRRAAKSEVDELLK